MKFCPSCGTALEGETRFCAQCGAVLAGAPPLPTVAGPPQVAPPAGLPPLRAAPTHTNWPAVILGLFALAFIAGGVSFLLLRDDGAGTSGATTTQVAPTTTMPSVTSTVVAAAPATQLATIRDADRATVESLVGRWVPQLSAKRDGTEADGIIYAAGDIVALHARLHAQYGAVLLWSGEYVYEQGDLWISVAPKGFATPEEALAWCAAASLDRDNCLAKLITHDASVGDTARLQP